MQKPLIKIIQYLIFLSLGVVFVWLAVKDISDQDWLDIKYALKKARHWLIIPVVLMILLSHYSRAIRWKILMEPLGYAPSTFNTCAAVMIGYLVNAGVPRLGEVVKCTLLAKYEKVRADKLVGTIVVERALDLICLIIVFIAALWLQGHVIGEYISELFGNFIKDKTGHISTERVSLIFFIIVFFLIAIYFLLKRFGHMDAVAKFREFIRGIGHGLGSIKFIRRKGWFLFHTALIWAMYLLSTTVGLYALQETDHLGILAGLTTLAVGSIGMIITPGGIGAYPLLVAKLMESYGLNAETTGKDSDSTAFHFLSGKS
jgi:uncharacterized membrane protein YbhN (UPF0104 family)